VALPRLPLARTDTVMVIAWNMHDGLVKIGD
jgi:hypothetical protein